MITSSDALTRLKDAGAKGQVSASALANITKWLEEAPFLKYRTVLLEDIELKALE